MHDQQKWLSPAAALSLDGLPLFEQHILGSEWWVSSSPLGFG